MKNAIENSLSVLILAVGLLGVLQAQAATPCISNVCFQTLLTPCGGWTMFAYPSGGINCWCSTNNIYYPGSNGKGGIAGYNIERCCTGYSWGCSNCPAPTTALTIRWTDNNCLCCTNISRIVGRLWFQCNGTWTPVSLSQPALFGTTDWSFYDPNCLTQCCPAGLNSCVVAFTSCSGSGNCGGGGGAPTGSANPGELDVAVSPH
jgi:hypothetical protein